MAVLAQKSGHDPLSLLNLLRNEPRIFDSIWYQSFEPSGLCDIDAILQGDEI